MNILSIALIFTGFGRGPPILLQRTRHGRATALKRCLPVEDGRDPADVAAAVADFLAFQ
jgi:hypothetical protein